MEPQTRETAGKGTRVRRSLVKTFAQVEAMQPTPESVQTVLQGEVEVWSA